MVFIARNKFLSFFESAQYQALTIFSFLLSTYNRNTYGITVLRYAYPMENHQFIVYRFVPE